MPNVWNERANNAVPPTFNGWRTPFSSAPDHGEVCEAMEREMGRGIFPAYRKNGGLKIGVASFPGRTVVGVCPVSMIRTKETKNAMESRRQSECKQIASLHVSFPFRHNRAANWIVIAQKTVLGGEEMSNANRTSNCDL